MRFAECDHDWEFHSIGVSFRPPRYAIFVCMRCKERAEMQVMPGTYDPDFSIPKYILRRGTPQIES